MKVKFIKLLDEKIANALNGGGFSYIKEKINGNQTVYCFKESPELVSALESVCKGENYQEAIIVVQNESLFY